MWLCGAILMLQGRSIVYGVYVCLKGKWFHTWCLYIYCYHQRSTLSPLKLSRCKGKGRRCVCVCMEDRYKSCVSSCLVFRSCEAWLLPCVCSCMDLVIAVSQALCQLSQTTYILVCMHACVCNCSVLVYQVTGCTVVGGADNTGQTGVALCGRPCDSASSWLAAPQLACAVKHRVVVSPVVMWNLHHAWLL